MNELDFLNKEEDLNKIGDIGERKQKAINDLYNYISREFKNGYYNYIDLLNNKDVIIQEILSKYDIVNEKDIMQIYNKYDSFYSRLKNQANELRKQKIKNDAVLVEIIGWIIIVIFLFMFFG